MKLGRNEPCHCGSGKKYKRCCLRTDEQNSLSPPSRDSRPPDSDSEDDEYIDETSADDAIFVDDAVADDVDWPKEHGREGQEVGGEVQNKRWDTYAERYRCDRFRADLPDLSGAEKKIIESWWTKFDKVYSGKGADPVKALDMIRAFSLDQPRLVSNLGLDEDALFELEVAFNKSGDYGIFMEFLMWFRDNHFDAYALAGTFYDCSVISYLVAHNRLEEISKYFSLFRSYPDKDPDNLMTVVELFQMTDNRQLLVALLKDIYPKIFYSRNVVGGQSFVYPMIIEAYCNHLDPGNLDPDLDAFLADLQLISEIVPHFGMRLGKDYWSEMIEESFTKTASGDCPPVKADVEEYYRKIRRQFIGYLLKKTGRTWHFAEYYGSLVGRYLLYQLRNNRSVRKTLAFHQKTVERFIVKNFQSFIHINELPSLAFLDAMRRFTGYLVEESFIPDAAGKENINVCRNLYKEMYDSFSKQCYAVKIFEDLFERAEENA